MSQRKKWKGSTPMIDSAHKICNECGETKPLKSFPTGPLRKDGTRSRKPKCHKCKESKYIESKRRRQRQFSRTDKRKQQIKEARERYDKTDKGKVYQLRLKEYQSLMYQRKKLIRRWEKRREQLSRIDFLPLIPIDRVWLDVKRFIERRDDPKCTCKECGTKYHWTVYWMNTSACSIECKNKRKRKQNRKNREQLKSNPDYKRLRNHKQRAKHYGVKYERVNIESIFVRDEYKCKGCGINVVRSKKYKPNQATIDHMIPLSRGGTHTRDNLITLCHQCNSEKSDKTWDEWGSAPINVKMGLNE